MIESLKYLIFHRFYRLVHEDLSTWIILFKKQKLDPTKLANGWNAGLLIKNMENGLSSTKAKRENVYYLGVFLWI